MIIPEFMFEEEDIQYLKNNNYFKGEKLHSKSKTRYFVLDRNGTRELIDKLYDTYGIEDKNRIEFDLRTVSNIFYSIVIGLESGKDSISSITAAIVSYYKINPLNAHKLMELLD